MGGILGWKIFRKIWLPFTLVGRLSERFWVSKFLGENFCSLFRLLLAILRNLIQIRAKFRGRDFRRITSLDSVRAARLSSEAVKLAAPSCSCSYRPCSAALEKVILFPFQAYLIPNMLLFDLVCVRCLCLCS